MKIQPYYYQEPIPRQVFNYLRKNKGKNPLVALPTGTGKTVVIADIVEQAISKWDIKILVISHVQEILNQDYHTITEYTDINAGLYSAGLKSKTIGNVTIAGIQSIFRKPELFKDIKFIIIDEAHLIPPREGGMYKTFLNHFKNVPVLGLTATKFRLGMGLIYGHNDAFFDDLIYDYTTYEKFNELIDKGFLCPARTHSTKLKLEPIGIRTQAGDFLDTDLSKAFDRDRITNAAIDEIIRIANEFNYKKWLIFAIDINHAEHIAERLIKFGVRSNVVHSKMDDDRAKILSLYENDFYTALINVNMLTTGYNSKRIDFIIPLRPTKSPVYHVQMIGRGTRTHPDKEYFGVADFAGNTQRLGPINDVQVQRKRKSTGGDPITKKCPNCDAIHHPRVRFCFCGHEFRFKHGIGDANGLPIIKQGKLWLEVESIEYNQYNKINRPSSLLVTYKTVEGIEAKEWICLQHPGFAGHMAKHWVNRRYDKDVKTVKELLKISNELKEPIEILVNFGKKFNTVEDYSF